MSPDAISPLRRRMIEDMTIRQFGEHTQRDYVPAHEFIRRFLLHVLPDGFHRIRQYGLLASGRRAGTIARIGQIMKRRLGSRQKSCAPTVRHAHVAAAA